MIFVNPYCRSADFVSVGIAKRQAAAAYLNALVDAGILMETRLVGKTSISIARFLSSLQELAHEIFAPGRLF